MADDVVSRLESEYCPPLDAALLSAILLDYDLLNDESLNEARVILDSLRESAVEEESSGFDPAGSGAQDTNGNNSGLHTPSHDDNTSALSDDGVAGVSDALDRLAVKYESSDSESGSRSISSDLNCLDLATQTSLLKEAFPDTSDYSISHALKKSSGNFDRALDDLLNQAYFHGAAVNSDGEPISAKGIEAFSEENLAKWGRKGRKKRKAQRSTEEEGRSSSMPSGVAEQSQPVFNKWRGAQQDVDFIVFRTGLDSATVRSAYNKAGSSLPATIASLLKDVMSGDGKVTSGDETVQAHAIMLGHDFPRVAPDYLTAIIRVTHPSTKAAHELAEALVTKRSTANNSSHVVPQYKRVDLSGDESDVSTSAPSTPRSITLDHPSASAFASSYQTVRSQALAQAQAAYRKSRSDRLMAGAAGYYAEVGREHSARSLGYRSAAADALVDSQSTGSQIDLHGVSVQDAVRIARQRVESWWNGLGESRVNGRRGAQDRAQGFTIITGVGRHSEGGKGKLGPAVTKVLVAEGWRIENNGGTIMVRGKAKSS